MTVHIRRGSSRKNYACAIIAASLSLAGCKTQTTNPVKPYKGLSKPDNRVALMPGDLLEIKFFYTPELNESQQIRADGRISLQLVGDVTAAGLNPAQLKKVLEKKFTGLIDRPSVVVIPREMQHRKVYVSGSVQDPGVFDLYYNMTALSAIMEAGGFNPEEAELSNIIVLRRAGDAIKTYCLDFQDALNGNTPHAPFYLHAQDIVFVQRTGVVKTAQWISQHINEMIPQFGFTYFYNTGTGDSTIGVDTSP